MAASNPLAAVSKSDVCDTHGIVLNITGIRTKNVLLHQANVTERLGHPVGAAETQGVTFFLTRPVHGRLRRLDTIFSCNRLKAFTRCCRCPQARSTATAAWRASTATATTASASTATAPRDTESATESAGEEENLNIDVEKLNLFMCPCLKDSCPPCESPGEVPSLRLRRYFSLSTCFNSPKASLSMFFKLNTRLSKSLSRDFSAQP